MCINESFSYVLMSIFLKIFHAGEKESRLEDIDKSSKYRSNEV